MKPTNDVRRLAKVLVTLALLVGLATSGRAGLYNTSEPEEEKKSDNSIDARDWFLVFRETLIKLRSIGLAKPPIDNALRKRYVLEAELATNLSRVNLSTEQKLNLGAVLIRRKKLDDAKALLEPLERQLPKNFLVLSNLATAYQLLGQESRAIDTLGQALNVWPRKMDEVEEPLQSFLHAIAWHTGAFDFYRRAETYQLKLLKLRQREALAAKGARSPFETVDALFDDGKNPPTPVKFVGESGKFEPGKLAMQEKAKLPKDAIDIVQQLLIWLPEDVRLYWLLGELYNAQGGAKNIQAARMILDELGGFDGLGVRAAELAEHRKELRNYQNPDVAKNDFNALEKKMDNLDNNAPETGFRLDWQSLGVGFGTGFLVALFGIWQIREIRRRRQKRTQA